MYDDMIQKINKILTKDKYETNDYCSLEKGLGDLLVMNKNDDFNFVNYKKIIDGIFKGINDKNCEQGFVGFLIKNKIQVIPNIAQRSVKKYYIKDNELKSDNFKDCKHVDGWLKNPTDNGTPKWIPYDVKKFDTSCLGMTENEIDKYLKLHKKVLMIAYDKKNNVCEKPQFISELSNWGKSPYKGPIEYPTKKNNQTILKVIGDGYIIPTGSKYALFITNTYASCDEDYYHCQKFNNSSELINTSPKCSFHAVINHLFPENAST